MATTRDKQAPVSWEEMLLAINPNQASDNFSIRELVDAIQETHQDNQTLDPQVEEYLKLLIAASMYQEISAMIGNLFIAREHRRSGIRSRRRHARNTIAYGERRPIRPF